MEANTISKTAISACEKGTRMATQVDVAQQDGSHSRSGSEHHQSVSNQCLRKGQEWQLWSTLLRVEASTIHQMAISVSEKTLSSPVIVKARSLRSAIGQRQVPMQLQEWQLTLSLLSTSAISAVMKGQGLQLRSTLLIMMVPTMRVETNTISQDQGKHCRTTGKRQLQTMSWKAVTVVCVEMLL